MTGIEMWETFLCLHPEYAQETCEIWCYGDAADKLAALTVAGVKTATASAYALYEQEGCELPKAGDYSVITYTDGTAACVIRTTRVTVVPFREVTAGHARKEGEGDRSLAYWREVHETFFTRELARIGMPFTEDMQVVCEEFEVVYSY